MKINLIVYINYYVKKIQYNKNSSIVIYYYSLNGSLFLIHFKML